MPFTTILWWTIGVATVTLTVFCQAQSFLDVKERRRIFPTVAAKTQPQRKQQHVQRQVNQTTARSATRLSATLLFLEQRECVRREYGEASSPSRKSFTETH